MEPQAKLTIVLTDDGRIGVSGPIDNKVLCYGLLEAAKDAVRNHRSGEPKIERPNPDQVRELAGV